MQNEFTLPHADLMTTREESGSTITAFKEAAAHPIAKDIKSLSVAGTMQLRTIGKVLHIKNYSKLKRDDLILAIIAKKEELWKQQQQEIWK